MDGRREDVKIDLDGISLLCQMEGQSSQDQWKRPAPRGRWKEVSDVVGDLGSLPKDEKSSWQKSCKESMNREQEVLVMAN